jgi:DNA uptake protein ComE-like DNA-binding protein
MKFYALSVLSILIALFPTGCQQKQSSQDLKEKTAQTTAEVKRDAKAIAAGIREGWNRDKPLDLNAASKRDIESLPGLNSDDADRILAARPYQAPDDLVKRHILSQSQFDKISDRVVTR